MTTFVGTEENFLDAIVSLIKLDYAAIASYEEAISHLEIEEYKRSLEDFKKDHERHVEELGNLLKKSGITPPESAGAKQILTQGKVMFANLLGDKAILKAMKTNEDDTNTAYERVSAHPGKTPESVMALEKGLQDERKHRNWLETKIQAFEKETA